MKISEIILDYCEGIEHLEFSKSDLPEMVEKIKEVGRERNEAMKELRDLVEACDEFGGGASISHPRYTRQRAAARSFLENADCGST